jgi:hypothetical protein
MNTDEMIRDNGRMIARYTIKYRTALSRHEFDDAARYANLANQYVVSLVEATNDEFAVALATYCTSQGNEIAAGVMPAGHWLSDC